MILNCIIAAKTVSCYECFMSWSCQTRCHLERFSSLIKKAAHLTWTPADSVISWSTDGDLTLITHHSPTAWLDSDSIVMTRQWFDGITDSSPQLSEDEKGKQGRHIFSVFLLSVQKGSYRRRTEVCICLLVAVSLFWLNYWFALAWNYICNLELMSIDLQEYLLESNWSRAHPAHIRLIATDKFLQPFCNNTI